MGQVPRAKKWQLEFEYRTLFLPWRNQLLCSLRSGMVNFKFLLFKKSTLYIVGAQQVILTNKLKLGWQKVYISMSSLLKVVCQALLIK